MPRELPRFASLVPALIIAGAVTLAPPVPAQAQNGTWSQAAPATPPIPLREYGAIFDRGNQRYLMFDGFSNYNGPYTLYNDVWSLSVAGAPAWSHITIPGALPGPRHSPQWGYDAARNRVLIFGGYGLHYPNSGSFEYLNDVWQLTLDGVPQWTELFPAGQTPAGRLAGAAVFDPLRQRFVGFGGTAGLPVDTWVLNLQGNGQGNWQQLPINGTRPNGGYGMSSVYDAKRDRMIIFGGSISDAYYGARNDVWELDLHGLPQWSQVVTSSTKPPARRSHTAIFDPIRNRMIIYGGFDAVNDGQDTCLGDTWALDFDSSPPTWIQLQPAGTIPTGRDITAAAYDPIHDRMIIYGGWSSTAMLGDTQFLDWGEASAEANMTPDATATPTTAHLEWDVASATGTYGAVYRRDPGGVWTALATADVNASGQLIYDDTTVQPNTTYSYMMVVGSQRGETFGGETEVQVPSVVGVDDPRPRSDFGLKGVAPNPVVDRMTVSFALPSPAPASLELLDVMGRRWLQQDVALGPGSHQVDIKPAGHVPAGLYFLRLSQDGLTTSSRVAVAGTR